jgi:hypothetical protein
METARFLLARPVRTPRGSWRLLVYDQIGIEPGDYAHRSEVGIELPPAIVAKVMTRAKADGATIIVTHSHPSAEIISPSAEDLRGEALLLPAFHRRVPGVPHARLIVGPHEVHGTLFGLEGEEEALHLVDVGEDVAVLSGNGWASGDSGLAGDTREKYDRQVRAFGAEGQRALARLRVAVVGLGGTGSIVAQQLAHLGVGSFLLIDVDTIEASNLNRVVGAGPGDLGRPKVEVAREMIVEINPAAKIEAVQADVRDRSTVRLLLDSDVFMSCTDSQGSRAVLTQAAYQYVVPGFDVGVVIQTDAKRVTHVSGRVQMLAPNLPCLLCCGVLDAEAVRRDLLTDKARAGDAYIVGVPIPQPSVISVNGVASSLAVTMLLSAFTGVPYPTRNQRVRLEAGAVSRIDVRQQIDCPVCSSRGALARGDSHTMPGRG